MRKIAQQTFVADDGTPLEVTAIQAPNIEDVVVAEMQVFAFELFKGNVDSARRVGRDVREALLRFGVQ